MADIYMETSIKLSAFCCIGAAVEVIQHPYRTATIDMQIADIDLWGDEYAREDVSSFLDALAEKANKPRGNHVVYEIKFEGGYSYAVQISDGHARIGMKVVKGCW